MVGSHCRTCQLWSVGQAGQLLTDFRFPVFWCVGVAAPPSPHGKRSPPTQLEHAAPEQQLDDESTRLRSKCMQATHMRHMHIQQ